MSVENVWSFLTDYNPAISHTLASLFLQISKDEDFNANTFASRVPNLFTNILNCLSADKVLFDEGLPNIVYSLAKIIANRQFPLKSVLFYFFEENIRFFSLENTSGMWYHRETKMLWKAACEQFGGSALRFFSGWKHTGQIISSDSKPGIFDPTNSNIVFVVPSETTINKFSPYPGEFPKYFKPSINEQVIDLAVQFKPCDAAFCLKFEGRKISPGFQDNTGDIDLIGCEEGLTLSQKQAKHASRVEFLTKLSDDVSLHSIPHNSKPDSSVMISLKSVFQILSEENVHMRELRKKKVKGKDMLHKKAGDNWQTSKYKLAILSLQSTILQIDGLVSKGSDLCDSLCYSISSFQGSGGQWSASSDVNINTLSNFRPLPESPVNVNKINLTDLSIYLPQRSSNWFKMRKQFAVTGSTLYDIAGFDKLKTKRQYFDHYHKGIALPKPSEEVQKAMGHGTAFEDNVLATLCTKILPVYFPSLVYAEIGSVVLNQFLITILKMGSVKLMVTVIMYLH